MEFEDYKKFRWFYTNSGKLVVGGKSAAQNDTLLKRLKSQGFDFIVMHTSTPGSPFSVIISPINKVNSSDLEEVAVFTGCFSRAWRDGKKNALIHIFNLSQIYKSTEMKSGTWGVKGKVEKKSVNLELFLIKQKSVLRAVPEKTLNSKKSALLRIVPGKIDKQQILPKFDLELNENFSSEEILSALPTGGIKVIR